MAQRIVLVGATPNDGTGDRLRDAFVKVNANYTEQYTSWITSNNYTVGNTSVNTFINSTSISVGSIIANTTFGTNGQILMSNGTTMYWTLPPPGTNTAASYTWTNTHYFSNSVIFQNTISANGSVGTNNQVLTSNGSGVYWKSPTVIAPTTQTFTGGTVHLLALPVTDINSCLVTVDGLVQVPTLQYTIVGTTLTLSSVPNVNSLIEVRNFEQPPLIPSSQILAGDGITTAFTLFTPPTDIGHLLITVDGLLQIPYLHYTLAGAILTFVTAPISGTVIEVRTLTNG
jgi:hypothetical protein